MTVETITVDVLPLDRLTKIYMKIRTASAQLSKEYEAMLADLDAQKQAIANEMKDQMRAAGVRSVKTEFGTAILGEKTRYWTDDWDSFKKFVVQHDALDLFEKRIAQKNMAEFLQENKGLIPPGLNADSEYVVSVRKPT